MADQWRKNVLCRFFVNSSCRNGARCSYSHDSTLARPRLPCKFFQRGTCANGAQCHYLHEPAVPTDKEGASGAAAPPTTTVTEPAATGHTPGLRSAAAVRTRGVTGGPGSTSWADAPEFVPSKTYQSRSECDGRQYSRVVGESSSSSPSSGQHRSEDQSADPSLLPLCPYHALGECRYGEHCAMLHGDMCEYCQCNVLHPYDAKQRRSHNTECLSMLETDMEHSFRMADSTGKTCGICMETVVEKSGGNMQRFGILPGCNHCFCITCIRQWRSSEQFESKVTRGCPECRVHSDFVCPSRYWVDRPEEKKTLLDEYIKSCSEKPCRHFNQGRGECPFGDKCFFKHVYPDGAKAKLGPPRRRKRHNNRLEAELVEDVILSEFLDDGTFFDSDSDDDAYAINMRFDEMLSELFGGLS